MSEKKTYTEKIGRRKTSTSRVRLTPASKNSFTVNGIDVKDYFKTPALAKVVNDAMTLVKPDEKYEITVVVSGGGIHSQAEAIRHGLSRFFSEKSEDNKLKLKKEGYLKRDPRSKERRKFGLKKARKAPQWSKR
ncbi:MAG: 30S ribosomal protein S9 [Candidatus Pacebacteria bacterium]|nr:30S ribosomal protein S9 [Candidatus Paceibacterota bacterium]